MPSPPAAEGASQLFDPEAPPVDGPEVQEGAAGGPGRAEGGSGERAGVLSIGGLYDEVEAALAQSFPRRRHLWVRGEISNLSDHRSGHLYLDLVDPEDDGEDDEGGSEGGGAGSGDRGGLSRAHRRPPARRGADPALKVKCWRSSWAPLRHTLAKEGIELAEGMVVVLRGSLDLYRAKGELSLILADIDVTALLGRLAAQRTKLLHALETEGLLGRNASVPFPDLPLHVGLVASHDTEGCRDFLGQLTSSGFGFRISHVKVPVQGPGAPASIARALTMLSRSDCDVIALVRGGGARADLAAFETELVARAVAGATKPVLTGIGHTGDQTVADIVAARACITPTECGQSIVTRTRRWWADHVAGPADLLSRRVPTFLADAASRDARARGRLTAAARHQLRVHRDRLGARAGAAARRAPSRLLGYEADVRAVASRLAPLALGHLGRRTEQVQNWRRLTTAYDIDRQLERGYSLTLTTDGSVVRSVGDVAPQQEIVTRLADGSLHSTVHAVEPAERAGPVGPAGTRQRTEVRAGVDEPSGREDSGERA